MILQTINEQIDDKLNAARELVWTAQGLTEEQKEHERLMCILKAPVPTSSPLLDYVNSMRAKQ